MVEHLIPSTLQEALEYLNRDYTTIVSGGTDLMVQRRNWAELPPRFDADVVYIFHLQELKYITPKHNHICIGATSPLSDILEHALTPTLLKDAISIIASPSLRNMATIPGNIGNASPAGDTLPVLYVYDARIRIASIRHSKVLPIEQVIIGPRKTIIENNEMITEVILPKEEFTHVWFKKVGGRQADAISKVSFAGAARVKNHIIEDIRIAFGAVAPVVVRHRELEQIMIGHSVQDVKAMIPDILVQYSEHIKPIDDQRSNKEYRKQVARNILEAFLNKLVEE